MADMDNFYQSFTKTSKRMTQFKKDMWVYKYNVQGYFWYDIVSSKNGLMRRKYVDESFGKYHIELQSVIYIFWQKIERNRVVEQV